MNDEKYQIVTFGEIESGHERDTVESALMQLCRYSPQKLERVLSGERFVIKSGLERSATGRYLAALRKTGLVCKVEPLKSVASPDTIQMANDGASIPLAGGNTASQVKCPKCGTPQPKAVSCVHCSVIMDKYQSPQSPRMPHTSPGYGNEPNVEAKERSPVVILSVSVLLVAGLLAWFLVGNPFSSRSGSVYNDVGLYENNHFKFALSFPQEWKSFTVDEAIQCSTIRREYADQYLLLLSPTDPNHCLLVVNISGITLDYFNQKGWSGVVGSMKRRRPVLYESVDDINGLKVHRMGYNIAQSYREDAYFEANGTLIEVYFYVKRTANDTAARVAEMRQILNESLRAI